jgi:hypothetical protein
MIMAITNVLSYRCCPALASTGTVFRASTAIMKWLVRLIVKLGQQQSLSNGRSRSAERIETKFGLWVSSGLPNLRGIRFETADDARNDGRQIWVSVG